MALGCIALGWKLFSLGMAEQFDSKKSGDVITIVVTDISRLGSALADLNLEVSVPRLTLETTRKYRS